MLPIEGVRYHCQVCADFDFCQACFEKGESHGHAFERFDDQGQPAVFVGSPKAKSKEFYSLSHISILEKNSATPPGPPPHTVKCRNIDTLEVDH